MHQKLLFCSYMIAFSSTTTIFKPDVLLLKYSLLIRQRCKTSQCSSSSPLPSSPSAVRAAFSQSILFRIREAVHVITNSCSVAEMLSLQELCIECCTSIKPFPNHYFLPEYHYLPYSETPRGGRDPDDWQPRGQLKKEHSSGRLFM